MRGARSLPLLVVLLLSLVVAIALGACGSDNSNPAFSGDGGPDGTQPISDAPLFRTDVQSFGEGATGLLMISPADKTIDVTVGQAIPTQPYTATIGGGQVPASFSVDRGEIAAIVAGSGVLTPTGTLGGKANVTATYGGQTATTTVTVFLHFSQNGGAGDDAGGGAGGNGGVGGEGEGGQVGGGGQGTLNGNPMPDTGLAFLYPYDKTVWPRGILAPLLQWQPGTHTYDAVYIHLQEAAFEYKGYFAATATPFIHHPIPQQAWKMASYSNAGEPLVVTLVFSSGGVAYGPITESWKVAQGTLKGTVYYNSYGTGLATNYCDNKTWGGGGTICFGGATLAIHSGATDPVLVAGVNVSPPTAPFTGCRVCHSVSANGSTLVTQHGDDYSTSSAYALTAGNAETTMPPGGSVEGFPAIYPDGTFLFTNAAPLPGVNNTSPSALYAIPAGTVIASTGLPAGLRAGCPVFSPDGKHVAFNDYSTDQASLASLDFAVATNAFSNKLTLHTPPSGSNDMFPAFLPTNDAVLFQVETASEFGATRTDAKGVFWWVDLTTKTAHALDALNGTGYLPNGPNNHSQAADAVLNYEPTVNPVPSGGYAWVVFTSRRMYGNVGTIDAYSSDPRNFDLGTNVTTKKLWVAAIDLNAPAGTDPSHPAFYLPGQELFAGNSRGYWVVDPCHPNGTTCMTGDECCGGFCEAAADGGGLTCTNQKPMCAQEFENCMTDADCCGNSQGIRCINGRCAQNVPK
jgi:hypothetical protein